MFRKLTIQEVQERLVRETKEKEEERQQKEWEIALDKRISEIIHNTGQSIYGKSYNHAGYRIYNTIINDKIGWYTYKEIEKLADN